MYKRQEKAKELYRNKKTDISVCLAANRYIRFQYSPPSNKFLIQDCSVGAAETAAPP